MTKENYYHLCKTCWIFLFHLAILPRLCGQSDTLQPFPVDRQIAVDFLSHYYEQDGNHSAVTGGLGTEELTDLGGQLHVSIPMDSLARMHISTSLNHYTSASTDNIDSYVSSASRKDSRVFLKIGYGKEQGRSGWTIGGGGSFESDYLSTSLTASWYKQSEDGLSEFSLHSSLFLDTWLVIFPEELRAPGLASVPTNKRRSFQITATWSMPLNAQTQISATVEPVVQQGLLSTGFHRVYMAGEVLPKIERLPGWRWKFPGSIRLHHYLTDWLIARAFYRFYWDFWGILGHTASLELPLRPFDYVNIYPFYRFHWQRGSRWFAPYGVHDTDAMYYTSDYDLSGFYSQKVGVGCSVYPLYGLLRWKTGLARVGVLEQLDARYARFLRSDGLKAYSFSLNLRFRI